MISGAFASTMHLLFIALLVFGVNWQKKVEPQVNIVDLWSPPSAESQPKAVEPPPEPAPEVTPDPSPAGAARGRPTPPKPVAKPEVAKPDIAMKEKEKRRKIEERSAAPPRKSRRRREKSAKSRRRRRKKRSRPKPNELAKEQARCTERGGGAGGIGTANELDHEVSEKHVGHQRQDSARHCRWLPEPAGLRRVRFRHRAAAGRQCAGQVKLKRGERQCGL